MGVAMTSWTPTNEGHLLSKWKSEFGKEGDYLLKSEIFVHFCIYRD